MTRYAFYIDTTKCTGCEACVVACKSEYVDNDWTPYSLPQPFGQFWMNLHEDRKRAGSGKFRSTNLPFLCNHCANPPCQAAALNGAIYTRTRWFGDHRPCVVSWTATNRRCMPIRRDILKQTLNIPQKCTGCAHIVDNGVPQGITEPRCVAACPTGAITWGDYATLQPAIAAAGALPLHPEYGAEPMVFYNALPQKFVAGSLFNHATDLVVTGATVTATPLGGGTTLTTTSDLYGDFWFDGLPANATFMVTVKNSGMLTRTMLAYTGTDVDLGDIELF